MPGLASSRRTNVWHLLVALLLSAGLLSVVHPPAPAVAAAAVAAVDPCGPDGNKITCENSKPGTPLGEWNLGGMGSEAIQGFSTEISVNVGQRVDFKIDTQSADYDITIYRTGYYGGDGARKMAEVTPSASLPQIQPNCLQDLATYMLDCGNWGVSASWQVPATAVSGVYLARLSIPSQNAESDIVFVVRDDSSQSDAVFQTSDSTWVAYNKYGGSNFYEGGAIGRALKLSYNRPMNTRAGHGGQDFYFANEYPMVRFMEKNGYDVSYIASPDTDRRGSLLLNHKVFLSVGHDEYWSGRQRANVEAARDAGVNLMFLSGNEVYWRTRWEPSSDASRASYRTLVCYKETWGYGKIDPSSEWTGTFRDPRYAPASAGANSPENALTGTAYVTQKTDLALTVTQAEGRNRLWRHTPLATMTAAQTALAPHTVGFESDEDLDNGHRPDGLIRLSTTIGDVPEKLQDWGNIVLPGTTEHHMTLYRAPSGALVFGAGTVQWTWGLDEVHDSPFAPEPADRRIQQAQVNLFADMGVQPRTLDPALTRAVKSTDTVGPTTTITAPAAGVTRANGTKVTVTGTAADTGGGRVAGVEFSVDGGSSWSIASGRESWSFSYFQRGSGPTDFRVRAMDDSANIGAVATRSVTSTCPCSVFGDEVPANPASTDTSSVELGMRFRPQGDGYVSGVRFYKGSGNTGTHVGSLWSSTGELLARATFGSETATGWQSVQFGTAVPVAAGQTYVVSYTAPNGHYAYQSAAFQDRALDRPPLQVAGGFGAAPAGVYASPGQFPSSSFQGAHYFTDVLFTTIDAAPLVARDNVPLPGSSSVRIDTPVSAVLSKAVVAGSTSITLVDGTGAAVAGQGQYDSATRTLRFVPASALRRYTTYTVTVSARDNLGTDVLQNKSWTFRTARAPDVTGSCPCGLFDEDLTPGIADVASDLPVTLGVRFASEQDGRITGMRFWKGTANKGSHDGTLWSMSGQVLATGTFAGESTQGWQTLTFSSPVDVARDTEYVVSYRATQGHYAATVNAFASANLSRSPLRVDSTSGAYTYGTGFPGSPSSHNYLVDPIFEYRDAALTVESRTPADGATDVDTASRVTVWFSDALAPGHQLSASVGGTAVAGTTSLDSGGKRLSFVPAQPLPAGALATVSLSGVRSVKGVVLPDSTWSFRTASGPVAQPTGLFGDEVPTMLDVPDPGPVELGVAFTSSTAAEVTAVRFFKGGPSNGGTHVGSLWLPSTGQRLAQVTFTNETSVGWQTAQFSTPVPIQAGQTYVVSYLAPQGHYSATPSFFGGTPWVRGGLTAPSGTNGRYFYGAQGGMPSASYNATNYWVDALVRPLAAP